jgi:tetratricopeptide (TPR) repeat protein
MHWTRHLGATAGAALLILLTAAPLASAVAGSDATGAALPSAPVCHPRDNAADASPGPAEALLTGYGSGGFPITTRSAEAQAYFDNGMQLAHAFAHRAAISAFKRAEALDPTCAMCVWGEAWSRGPTINFDIPGKDTAELAALADRAADLARTGTDDERALTAALQRRYHRGGGKGPGDLAFAAAMDAFARAHPANNEAAVIAADAWMVPAALNANRNHLTRARELLLATLQRDPDHTGAIHFYIHATEMDHVGTLALPYAEKLQARAPSASHLVHMPSHTFLWAGRFRMAEQSNIDAVKIDRANAARLKTRGGVFGLIYHAHNVQFGLAAALLDNDADGALFLAADEVARLPEVKADDVYQQTVLGTAYFGYGRFADLAIVRALPDPGPRLPLDAALRQYAIGEAAARAGDVATLKAAIRAIPAEPVVAPGIKDRFDRAQAGALQVIARQVLIGRAAMLEHRYAAAAEAYRAAAGVQDAHLGQERDPPVWWYPVRRSLAAALLAEGNRDAARRELATVLTWWPYDPVSLKLLADVEGTVGPANETRLQQALSNWTGDIRTLPAAVI